MAHLRMLIIDGQIRAAWYGSARSFEKKLGNFELFEESCRSMSF